MAIVGSNTCSQMHVQMKYSVAHPQDLIPTLADVLCICITCQPKYGTNAVDMLENALFVHAFGNMSLSYQ